jgi:hypothetical protein
MGWPSYRIDFFSLSESYKTTDLNVLEPGELEFVYIWWGRHPWILMTNRFSGLTVPLSPDATLI